MEHCMDHPSRTFSPLLPYQYWPKGDVEEVGEKFFISTNGTVKYTFLPIDLGVFQEYQGIGMVLLSDELKLSTVCNESKSRRASLHHLDWCTPIIFDPVAALLQQSLTPGLDKIKICTIIQALGEPLSNLYQCCLVIANYFNHNANDCRHSDMMTPTQWKHIHEAGETLQGYNCDELHQLGLNAGEFILILLKLAYEHCLGLIV